LGIGDWAPSPICIKFFHLLINYLNNLLFKNNINSLNNKL